MTYFLYEQERGYPLPATRKGSCDPPGLCSLSGVNPNPDPTFTLPYSLEYFVCSYYKKCDMIQSMDPTWIDDLAIRAFTPNTGPFCSRMDHSLKYSRCLNLDDVCVMIWFSLCTMVALLLGMETLEHRVRGLNGSIVP